MKTLLFAILCSAISGQAFAENYVPVHVLAIDQNVNSSAFVGHYKKNIITDHDYEASERPSIEERDKIFTAVNIQDDLTSFDEFARDELFSRAAFYSVDELRDFYKAIPKSKLESLQAAVVAWNKNREAKR